MRAPIVPLFLAASGIALYACGAPAGRAAAPSKSYTGPTAQLPPVVTEQPTEITTTYEAGRPARRVTAEDAAREGLTVIDLSDRWAPRMFARNDPYRAEYVRLARRGTPDFTEIELAQYGVLPSFGAIREHMSRSDGDALDESYQILLRSLRERVADATGFIEDGSAGEGTGEVFAERLEHEPLADRDLEPLPNAAPDLLGPATEAAAEALGWTDAESARDALYALSPGELETLRVAVALPPAPPYHAEHMESLRLEIDRGDVYYELEWNADGEPHEHAIERPPTLVLYADHQGESVALVRYHTTIGGWRREEGEGGRIGYRYKVSPAGPRSIRTMIVAPAWLPPRDTPDVELMRRAPSGEWVPNEPLYERGWANAFGLVMMVHEDLSGPRPLDEGIRTHGVARFESAFDAYSHGCHRLWNVLAVRLAGFVLAHREHRAGGLASVSYTRRLEHEGDAHTISIEDRGYKWELDPPLPVRVLEGRILGDVREPPEELVFSPNAPSAS